MYLIIGYLFAIITGLILGMLGGGGSMMILPIFIYIFQLDADVAIVYSLFVIAFSSLIGSFSHYRMGHVNLKLLLVILSIGAFELKQATFLILIFVSLMIGAAVVMLRKKNTTVDEVQEVKINWLGLLLQGLFVGMLTGLVGAGGGFLIVPALMYFTKVPIRIAVGTSLSIIACNTSMGFVGAIGTIVIDWEFVMLFAALMGAGILLGSKVSKRLDQVKMKKAFGLLILVVAAFMLSKELFL